MGFWYLDDGKVYFYDLETWQAQPLALPAEGEIINPVISPDQNWIVYYDPNDLWLVSLKDTDDNRNLNTNILIRDWDKKVIFDPASRNILYTDAEGLKKYSLHNQNSRELVPNIFTPNTNEYWVYSPISISRSGKWVLLGFSPYEGYWHKLYSLSNDEIQRIPSDCMSNDYQWSPSADLLASNVFVSGIAACGEDEGLHLISPGKPVHDVVVLSSLSINDIADRLSGWRYDVAFSPDGDHLLSANFMELSPGTVSSYIYIANPNTQRVEWMIPIEFEAPIDYIWANSGSFFLAWAAEETSYRFYMIEPKTHTITSIDTGNMQIIPELLSPDDRFILAQDGLYILANDRVEPVISFPGITPLAWKASTP